MTESAAPSRIKAYVWAGAAVFVAAVVAVAGTLAWNARQAALADSEAQATRFVAGAEAALNRSLLAVDVLLASMDELLGLSNAMPKWLDADTASQRLRGSARQNLMVRYVAVLDSTGKALASSDPAGASLLVQLPAGFLESVLEQPVSTLMVSAPVVSFASSEKVLYFARHLRMADSSRVVAVAELPVSALSSVLVQGVDISGLQATLDQALESMVSGFLLLDSQHRVVQWNRQLETILPWLQGVITPLIPFRTVLEATVEHHVPRLSDDERKRWVSQRLERQKHQPEPREQSYANGSTIQITEPAKPDAVLENSYHDENALRKHST